MMVAVLLAAGATLTLAIIPARCLADEPGARTGDWRYGGFVDLSYAVNFNFPENHLWRSKTTTPRVNELAPNMVVGYARKRPGEDSRWGMELALQAGYDTQDLAPEPIKIREKPIDGADLLRRVGQANVSYLAPVGRGLTLTAGIFKSYIGYQSLYARDNLNYTRSYMADRSPYLLMGVAAQYPLRDDVSLGFFIVNAYTHLSHINDQPSYGAQISWRLTPRVTVTQNLYYGPDQADTSLRFWRFFSDSIVEWKHDRLTLAVAYDIGTEKAAESPNHPRTFWTAAAAFARWNIAGPWSVAVRPEFYWDRNGRMTGSEQLLKAVTTTLEHKVRLGPHTAWLRLEYRFDESTGPGGGFFKGGEIAPGVIGLTGSQHLAIAALIWAFDS